MFVVRLVWLGKADVELGYAVEQAFDGTPQVCGMFFENSSAVCQWHGCETSKFPYSWCMMLTEPAAVLLYV